MSNPIQAIYDYLMEKPWFASKNGLELIPMADGVICATWTFVTTNKTLKCQALPMMLMLEDGKATVYMTDFVLGTFLYADPKFPRNLLDCIRNL
jgi:hypothetical protein